MLHDQASGLRQLFSTRGAQTIAWFGAVDAATHGLLASAAAGLAGRGEPVLLIDEHPLPGLSRQHLAPAAPVHDLQALLRGEASLPAAPWRCAPRLALLTAHRLRASGMSRNHRMQTLMDELEGQYAYLLYDCPSHPDSVLVESARHWVVAVMAGKQGVMQAYATIKRLSRTGRERHIEVVVIDEKGSEARQMFENLRGVAATHLGLSLRYLGAMGAQDGQALAALLSGSLPLPQTRNEVSEPGLVMSA